MGAEPWSYFVPYRDDIEAAFEDLKQREFEAGRYFKPDWPIRSPKTIDEAVASFEEYEGTHSVLDTIGVVPLTPEQLIKLFGTESPSREMVEANDGYHELLDVEFGICIVVYEGDSPSELFFAGYHW